MKRFTIIAVLICLISLVGCLGNTQPKHEAVQVNPNEYIITEADYQFIIIPCVINSFLCESMRNALMDYDYELSERALNPEHDCLTCKVKALKFFYESDDWADTTGETGEAEDLETLLNTNVKFKALWDSIEL